LQIEYILVHYITYAIDSINSIYAYVIISGHWMMNDDAEVPIGWKKNDSKIITIT